MLVVLVECIKGWLHGVIKGLGKQYQCYIGALISYYFFGLPASYYLAFNYELNIEGIWLGYAIGVFLAIVYFFI